MKAATASPAAFTAISPPALSGAGETVTGASPSVPASARTAAWKWSLGHAPFVKTANASPAPSRATAGGEPPSASFVGSVKAAAPARRWVTSVRVDAEGHPGYLATARMLGEAGLLLAEEAATPQRAGCLTPATALGTASAPRFERARVRFGVGD